VRFDPILRDLPLEREFDYILIADRHGTVVHEAARPPAWEHRRDLHFADIRSLLDRKGAAIGLESLTRASRLSTLLLGGREYQMFSHPVRIALSDKPPETWILCGFIASSSVASEALAMPSLVILGLILLLVFGILPWPFLKLFLMEKRERFEFIDGYLLLFGTSVVPLLLTILVVLSR
jgi:hypothetical protein